MKSLRQLTVIVIMSIFILNVSAFAADATKFSTKPKLNNQKKWRIAYYEGGPFINYPTTLIEIVNGLIGLGWIESANIPEIKGKNTEKLWEWLSSNLKSDYLEFVKDAHYSANWNKNSKKGQESLRDKTARKIIKRFNKKKDIDLIIAMGTWAGQDLANDKHTINTLVCSTSDPITAKIIKSADDSGFSHVHARLDPTRYERQLKVFYDIIGFKKLGVAYKDTIGGRSYSAIATVEKMARELNFEIVRCHVKSDSKGEEEVKSLLSCYKKIAKDVDAIYVTSQTGVNKKSITNIVNLFNSSNIPSFSQHGMKYVKYGLLMSISQAGLKFVGKFHAKTIAQIFNGAKPGELNQVFKAPLSIALNLKTAELIGYDPPVDVIGAADEIFQEIETYKKK